MRLPPDRKVTGSAGQALVEFAVMLPLFLMLLFGMIDFGRAYSASVTLTNAAREGARYGVISPTDTTGISNRTKTTAGPYNDANLTVTPSCNPVGSCTSGNSVIVTTSYAFSFITPLAAIVHLASGGTLPSTITLKSSADMRIE